jgi:hypothetical protein
METYKKYPIVDRDIWNVMPKTAYESFLCLKLKRAEEEIESLERAVAADFKIDPLELERLRNMEDRVITLMKTDQRRPLYQQTIMELSSLVKL